MTPEDFQKFFPLVDNWIWAALAAHAGTARPVASCGFPRLPLYFTAETLASAKVVIMDRLPIPPLSSWGLTQFATFERGTRWYSVEDRAHDGRKYRSLHWTRWAASARV